MFRRCRQHLVNAVTVGPRTPFSPERQVGVRNFVEDSLSYPERNELAVNLVDTATMAPGIDETRSRELTSLVFAVYEYACMHATF